MRLPTQGQTTRSHEDGPSLHRHEGMRGRLVDFANRRFGPAAPWVQRHVANCPRCQRRLAALGRVDLALSVIKSQPHRLDLLTRANHAAIHMLSRPLRQAAEADKLDQAGPAPSPSERWTGSQNALVNMAACLAVLVLAKAGIFTSLDKAHTCGRAAMKQYYTNHAGEDLANEVFKT